MCITHCLKPADRKSLTKCVMQKVNLKYCDQFVFIVYFNGLHFISNNGKYTKTFSLKMVFVIKPLLLLPNCLDETAY